MNKHSGQNFLGANQVTIFGIGTQAKKHTYFLNSVSLETNDIYLYISSQVQKG